MKIAKNLIEKNHNVLDALLAYRSTPLANGFSPSELLMGRKLETLLPMLPSKFNTPLSEEVYMKENQLKEKKRQNFNKRHKVKQLRDLIEGESV